MFVFLITLRVETERGAGYSYLGSLVTKLPNNTNNKTTRKLVIYANYKRKNETKFAVLEITIILIIRIGFKKSFFDGFLLLTLRKNIILDKPSKRLKGVDNHNHNHHHQRWRLKKCHPRSEKYFEMSPKEFGSNWQRCSIILKRACQKGWEGGQKWETEELTVENWWPSFNRNIKGKIPKKWTDFGYYQHYSILSW